MHDALPAAAAPAPSLAVLALRGLDVHAAASSVSTTAQCDEVQETMRRLSAAVEDRRLELRRYVISARQAQGPQRLERLVLTHSVRYEHHDSRGRDEWAATHTGVFEFGSGRARVVLTLEEFEDGCQCSRVIRLSQEAKRVWGGEEMFCWSMSSEEEPRLQLSLPEVEALLVASGVAAWEEEGDEEQGGGWEEDGDEEEEGDWEEGEEEEEEGGRQAAQGGGSGAGQQPDACMQEDPGAAAEAEAGGGAMGTSLRESTPASAQLPPTAPAGLMFWPPRSTPPDDGAARVRTLRRFLAALLRVLLPIATTAANPAGGAVEGAAPGAVCPGPQRWRGLDDWSCGVTSEAALLLEVLHGG